LIRWQNSSTANDLQDRRSFPADYIRRAALGIEVGRPGETFRRARIASDFGKLTALDRRPTPRAGGGAVRAGSACRRERVGLARPEGGEAGEAEEDHRPGRGLGHGNRDQPSGAGGNRHAQVERSERSVGLHLKSDK
jgi:hypothetical protein